MTYVIIALFIVGIIIWAIVSFFGWLASASKTVKTRLSVDKSRNIIERNEGIIQKCLNEIYSSDRSYYIENEVRDCIGEIAQKEGRSDIAPKWREWLSQWETRPDIPKEYIELKDYLKQSFSEKHKELLNEKKIEKEKLEKEEKEAIAKNGGLLFENNKDLIDKFLEITERKVSIIDDYGDEDWDVLQDEILACLKKVGQKEKTDIDWQGYSKGKRRGYFNYDAPNLPDEYEWLQKKLEVVFREYHKSQKSKTAKDVSLNNLSGVEFETWITKLLKENDFTDVRGTPATGDQGADLIAKRDGKTVIIQAKRYQGTVGNKAVQEVVGAVNFYGGDMGWVITNSTFTPSAKSLAQKNNVKLIDGRDLQKIANGSEKL